MGFVASVSEMADMKTDDEVVISGWTKAEIDAAIQVGLEDIEAGREAPAAEVEQRLRAKLGL